LIGRVFEVLNAMAPLVWFGAKDERTSATPFAREWEILKTKEATQEVYAIHILALRSSNVEFLVPFAFRWLFGFMMAVAVVVAVVNWSTLTIGIFDLKQPVSTGGPTMSNPSSPPTGRP
jgi:hypothetical protein